MPTGATTLGDRPADDPSSRHFDPETLGTSLALVQRTVPLVAARRIVPALAASTLGSLPTSSRSRPVVVARVIAPSPPASDIGGTPEPRTSLPNRAASSSWPADTVTADRHGSPVHEANRMSADEPWTSGPDVVASVSRLATAPAPHDESLPSAPTSMLAVAVAQPRIPTRPNAGSRPVAVQRLGGLPSLGQAPAGLPSLGQLPSGLPSMGEQPPDLPSVEQLESRAGEMASDASDRLRTASEAVTAPATAAAAAATAAATAAGGAENVEQLVRKLYGPLVRRIKAELLLDRERRGIRIDGI